MNNALANVISVAVAIVGLAMVAVLVAPRAKTAEVITSTGNALANTIRVAVSPVAGGGLGAP